MLAVVVAPHGFTTAFASEASIVPRASHRQITPTACPGRILRAEPQVRYPLILTASHAASCRTPLPKPAGPLSWQRAFQFPEASGDCSSAHHAPTSPLLLYSLPPFPLYAAFRRSKTGRNS